MELLEQPDTPPVCDCCGTPLRFVHFDYGIDQNTGYHDDGDYFECPACGLSGEL